MCKQNYSGFWHVVTYSRARVPEPPGATLVPCRWGRPSLGHAGGFTTTPQRLPRAVAPSAVTHLPIAQQAQLALHRISKFSRRVSEVIPRPGSGPMGGHPTFDLGGLRQAKGQRRRKARAGPTGRAVRGGPDLRERPNGEAVRHGRVGEPSRCGP